MIFLSCICTALLLIVPNASTFCSVRTNNPEKKQYVTVKIESIAPVIDGIINEQIWEQVEWSGGFIQRYPTEDTQPSQNTVFKILYDEEHLYVAARMYDSEPDKIMSMVTRRDNTQGDMISIIIDSNNDLRTAYRLGVTVSGVKLDDIYTDNGNQGDSNWDPVWYVETNVDEQGWTAEMKIPFSQMRFSLDKEQKMGLNLWRRFYRNNEYDFWQPIPQRVPGHISLAGELVGIEGLNNLRKMEFLPFTTGKLHSYQKETGNPLANGRDFLKNGGLDGKIGLSGNFTLDFTVNPDFGQVEADPSEMNLTAFETFFQEKRPFFIEGKEILDSRLGENQYNVFTGNNKLFHSRRIGSSPSYTPSVSEGEYYKAPQYTSILSAVKLTGKTRDGWSIGLLESITQKETADFYSGGTRTGVPVEPLTNYFVGRVIKDSDRGNTIFGGQLTAVNRRITDNNLELLPDAAYTGGLDFRQFWMNKKYFLNLSGMFSQLQGSEEAMLNVQRAPARYYQRPDNKHSSVDSARTSLFGHGGLIELGRNPVGNWNYSFGFQWYTPGLELNDTGFLSKANLMQGYSLIRYEYFEPTRYFRNFSITLSQQKQWNFSGDNVTSRYNSDIRLYFNNFWRLRLSTTYAGEYVHTGILRGGPGVKIPWRKSVYTILTSNQNKKIQLSLVGYYSWGKHNAKKRAFINPGLTWRPSGSLQISATSKYDINDFDQQYITTQDNSGVPAYITGFINRKTLDFVFRLNYSLTPNLSIEYYGQPFISAGRYSKIKKITDSRAQNYYDRFHQYSSAEISLDPESNYYEIDENGDGGTDLSFYNPDFNFRQFRSNFVLRWEYNPGSTIYLVWAQERTGRIHQGDFSFSDDMQGLFDIYPDNIFMIKLNKWFSY